MGTDSPLASGALIPSVRTLLNPAATPKSALELSSPNVQTGGTFGYSVASSGSLVVIGAPYENVSGQTSAGHAYVLSAKTGTLISTLTSPNPQTYGFFGYSVAISGTTVAVVGAFGENVSIWFSTFVSAGHAYTFNAKTGALISTLTSPHAQNDGYFGLSVAIGGKTVVVGAWGETVSGHSGAGRAYTFNATTGARILTLKSPHAQTYGSFGLSVAIAGKTVAVGAWGETASGLSGAGRAYTFNATTGARILTLKSPNAQTGGNFGVRVAISGTTVVVGAMGETGSGQLQAGHAYTFSATTGKRIATLTSPSGQMAGFFGGSVAISGSIVVVGAQGETASGLLGAGHAYTFNATTGKLISTLTSLNAQTDGALGLSVAISGTTALVGAAEESALGLSDGGLAYLFQLASSRRRGRQRNRRPPLRGGSAVGPGNTAIACYTVTRARGGGRCGVMFEEPG